MANQADDLTAERAATDMYNRLFSVMRLPEHEHHAKARLKLFYQVTRQEALREAARVCSEWYKIDRTDIHTVAEMAEVLATTLDRLASEGG